MHVQSEDARLILECAHTMEAPDCAEHATFAKASSSILHFLAHDYSSFFPLVVLTCKGAQPILWAVTKDYFSGPAKLLNMSFSSLTSSRTPDTLEPRPSSLARFFVQAFFFPGCRLDT